jgi:hypothetical protein
MQRFTLIHDGSDQGWQAAYLAFHVAAQLGAPLLVLLFDSTTDKKELSRRATQIEVGGRAAGVAIGTRLLTDFSIAVVLEHATDSDGLFVPRNLIPDGKAALRFLEALSCPIWVVSHEAKFHKLAVLVSDMVTDENLISYTAVLSHRLQQALIGLTRKDKHASTPQSDIISSWIPLSNFSPREITTALDQYDIDMLFIPASRSSLIQDLDSSCVVCPFP